MEKEPPAPEEQPTQLGSIRETFGAFVHSHGRAGELLEKYPDVSQEVANYSDARVYLETTLRYLDQLAGDAKPLALVDTEHAAWGSSEGFVGGNFPNDPEKIKYVQEAAGRVILERAKLIGHLNESGEYQTKSLAA